MKNDDNGDGDVDDSGENGDVGDDDGDGGVDDNGDEGLNDGNEDGDEDEEDEDLTTLDICQQVLPT